MNTKRAIFVRKFGRIAAYVVLFILFSGAVYWLGMRTCTIKNIVVVGHNIQVEVTEARLPKTLILFPAAKLRAELLADNPTLADIRFQKKYPHTLIIIPTLRTAIARLTLTGREVLVDEKGMVLADADPASSNIPRLIVPLPAVRIGETIGDPRVISGISFLIGSREIVLVHTISVEDEKSLRAKSDRLDILFVQDGSVPATLATLQTLLSGFRIKGTLPTFIDLRFNKPIIKF